MKAKGAFSLIELMVVIAIVALLAAVAIPSYKNYISRSKVAEVMSMIQSQLAKVQLFIDAGTPLPVATGACYGGPPAVLGSYINAVDLVQFQASNIMAFCFMDPSNINSVLDGNGGAVMWVYYSTTNNQLKITGCAFNYLNPTATTAEIDAVFGGTVCNQ